MYNLTHSKKQIHKSETQKFKLYFLFRNSAASTQPFQQSRFLMCSAVLVYLFLVRKSAEERLVLQVLYNAHNTCLQILSTNYTTFLKRRKII